jgi:putative addiction module component (TIGR02574 family)
MRQDLLAEAQKLSFAERLELAEAIWDSVQADASSDQIAVPEFHREILDERLAAEEAKPGASAAWSEVRERLQRGL